MSDQAWALQAMFKYRLQVDFHNRTIDVFGGYHTGWYWDDVNIDFYQALQNTISYIEQTA